MDPFYYHYMRKRIHGSSCYILMSSNVENFEYFVYWWSEVLLFKVRNLVRSSCVLWIAGLLVFSWALCTDGGRLAFNKGTFLESFFKTARSGRTMSSIARAKQFSQSLIVLRKRLNRCFAQLLLLFQSNVEIPSFEEILSFCTMCSFSACKISFLFFTKIF